MREVIRYQYYDTSTVSTQIKSETNVCLAYFFAEFLQQFAAFLNTNTENKKGNNNTKDTVNFENGKTMQNNLYTTHKIILKKFLSCLIRPIINHHFV